MVGLLLAAIVGVSLVVGTTSCNAAELDRSLQARLSSDRLGHLEPGTYLVKLTVDGKELATKVVVEADTYK